MNRFSVSFTHSLAFAFSSKYGENLYCKHGLTEGEILREKNQIGHKKYKKIFVVNPFVHE